MSHQGKPSGGPSLFQTERHDTPDTLAVGERVHDRTMAAWERVELAKKEADAKFSSPEYLKAQASMAALAAMPPPARHGIHATVDRRRTGRHHRGYSLG